MKFKDKTVLITGASSGIGKAFALKVAEDGGTLILAARNLEKLNEVKSLAEAKGAKVEVYSADVTKVDEIRDLFLKATEGGRKLDAVFNNAGLGFIANIWDLTAEQIEKMISVNVTGMIMVTKFATEVMTRQKDGHIFMTSSLAGLVTLPQWSVYVASKWAITGFADSIRPELKQYNVKVSTLHPGAVKTEFFDKEKANIDAASLGQAIEASEVAEAVYNAFFTNKKKVIIPGMAKSFAMMKRYLPGVSDFLIQKMASKVDYHKEEIKEDEPGFSYVGEGEE